MIAVAVGKASPVQQDWRERLTALLGRTKLVAVGAICKASALSESHVVARCYSRADLERLSSSIYRLNCEHELLNMSAPDRKVWPSR
jgi:outer membrane murein-binding lipoprotein Lpp